MPQHPSIQSFFPSSPYKSSSSGLRSSSPTRAVTTPSFNNPGDGFSAEEVEAVLQPPSAQWTPSRDYEESEIGKLEPGPKLVTFMGRIVNFYDMVKPSNKPSAAKGCLKLTVSDNTGALTVRLWYAQIEYKVRLGQLLTVWTVHVSHGENASLAPTSAPLFTSIFPERERSCHIMMHENSDDGTMCKKPYRCKDTDAIAGLMTVKNFIDGGYDVDNGKLLVCVKSIGARKKFKNKNGNASELIVIGIFDDTAEASLTLYGSTCGSAYSWKPSHTVLLIASPGWRIDRMVRLSLNANTRIDVDPDMKDALWLRALAQRLTRKEHVNPAFPEGVFDVDAAETGPVRILYTLSDIDEFARANPTERFVGYISVLITQLHIVTHFRRNMLLCTECCGIPLYANTVTAQCKQCEKRTPLRINPRILGPVIDETGQINSGKLIFSDRAWEQLLGRTAQELASTRLDVLQYLEQRLLFIRVTLGFGWCLEGTEPVMLDEDEEKEGGEVRARKRRRLNVFKEKERKEDKGAEKREGTAKGSEEPHVIDKRKDQIASSTSPEKTARRESLGEVGRLCIWCVKT